ncbi:PAN2-PAN3 deadenylation complex subunit pan3-like isoform X2 [Strongylocentrotus purpuratus]|uniref:PAN2-PAN3 deadenylation complex subunit PAN3 n=1 Tax=Strongylocentrotus purpuratus TaxID=7668 RepID=A0A7M7NH54_STRPU|nr:PAN2-PAN3 deadenylation complex subunit pan3 isoform X2 [Strongylocentrotus purpuratus]XP_030836388.1 PAN2-PAN3 deadenylation complex subunit pan3-like isoform X2 [Strongylocentrotus purpuratus]
MDLADPHMADHFFNAPFDSDNYGPQTSKLQHLMQRSHSVGSSLSTYTGSPGSSAPGGQKRDESPSFQPGQPGVALSTNDLSSNFSNMHLNMALEGMEFVPGAQNTPKSEFQPRNSRGDFQPPPQQPPPSAMSVPPPPLPVTPTKDAGPLSLNEFKPQSKLKSLTPGVPEFVPRPLSQGSSMLPTPVTQGQVASAIPRTNAGGLMSNDFVSGSLSAGASPLHSPGGSPNTSRKEFRRAQAPSAIEIDGKGASKGGANYPGVTQENIGGTTYFYTDDQGPAVPQAPANAGIVLPTFHVYPSTPAHVDYMKRNVNGPSFFMDEEFKIDVLNKQAQALTQLDLAEHPDIPTEVDNYHSLFPLEPSPKTPMDKSSTFGYTTTCYKAMNKKDSKLYCLRRIHGFRVGVTQWMVLVDKWKKLQHSNIVSLREVFSTKAFGEHSIVFVHDYHPGATTLMSRHFGHSGGLNSFRKGHSGPFPGSRGGGGGGGGSGGPNGPRGHSAGLLPEGLIWTYIVQLSSALRAIHTAGLACRVMDPTKILILAKSRLRVNCVGIFDVLTFDPSQSNPLAMISHYQQEDLISLGKVILALACNSVQSIQRQRLSASVDLVAHQYSADLKNLVLYLLTSQPRPRSVNDIMPMIGARFYTQLDAALMCNDVLEEQLSREIQNGRLFRLLCKLGVMNERPEFHGDVQWAETGDRYLLKLFRDHLFHQVKETGNPWIDLSHIVQCLNKLDAGIPEKVCLMSRDEQNILVVSYSDLKHCFQTTFSEVFQASQPSPENIGH